MTTSSHAFHQTFPAAFESGARTFEADYLLFASSGMFLLEVGDRQWLLPPQRAALIAAGTVLSVRTRGPTMSSSVLFHEGELGRLDAPCRIFAMSDLARLMTEHAMRWDRAHDAGPEAADFFRALAGVVSELAAAPLETWLPLAQSRNLRRACAHALAHLDENIGAAALAGAAGLSERTLGRRARQELGMSLSEFLHRARMIKAMELLAATSDSVTQIGLAAGFESTSSFIKAFRAFAGSTPLRYRRLSAG